MLMPKLRLVSSLKIIPQLANPNHRLRTLQIYFTKLICSSLQAILHLPQPQIVSPAMPNNAFVSVLEASHQPNNLLYAPHSSQQEDQLCKVSAPLYPTSHQVPYSLLL